MDKSTSLSSLYEIVLDVSRNLGLSVIPLTGKRPIDGFDFSKYQTHRPNLTDLDLWFRTGTVTSYGVVCGKVSGGLLVLDFDADTAYQNFTSNFPLLALSYTVKTRRGFHVYLRSQKFLRSRKIFGGDLLAHGSLVVGAGSVVNGYAYHIAIDAPIINLSESDLARVLETFTSVTTLDVQHERSNTGLNEINSRSRAISRLITTYKNNAPAIGRNNALYRSAYSAACAGLNLEDTVGSLATLHTATPAFWAHAPEAEPIRLREALTTITSAYRCAQTSTPKRGRKNEEDAGLPNAIREALLAAHTGSTVAARLLDAFALAGWAANHIFSTSDAVALAKGFGIGKSSVLATLSGKFSQVNGVRLVHTAAKPIEEDDTQSSSHSQSTKNPVGDRDNKKFNPPGRKKNYYSVPDLTHLYTICDIVPVKNSTSDKLTTEDLVSDKAYRMALHRELVRRASPELSYKWHASRLTVSQKTIRRYNAALKVIVTPIFGYMPLSWDAIDTPSLWGAVRVNQLGRDVTPGQWLQNKDGKRYPAIQGIGSQLLTRRESAVICKRLPSRMQLPEHGLPVILYPCIWRRLNIAAPDWGGGEYDYPIQILSISPSSGATQSSDYVDFDLGPNSEPDSTAQDALLQYIEIKLSMPQDLTVIKGIGEWRQKVLNHIGITRYKELASADPNYILRRSHLGQYLTLSQVAFWIYQAKAISDGVIMPEALEDWSYKDWKVYEFERTRIVGANTRLRIALAAEFRDHNWLKYRGELPAWFVQLITDLKG